MPIPTSSWPTVQHHFLSLMFIYLFIQISNIYCFKNASLGLNNNTCDIRFNIDTRTENKKKVNRNTASTQIGWTDDKTHCRAVPFICLVKLINIWKYIRSQLKQLLKVAFFTVFYFCFQGGGNRAMLYFKLYWVYLCYLDDILNFFFCDSK